MTSDLTETDCQFAIMLGNGQFADAADYAMRTAALVRSKRGKTLRARMRAVVAVLIAASWRPEGRAVAIDIYRTRRPKLTRYERAVLAVRLGEDFDVLPVDDRDVLWEEPDVPEGSELDFSDEFLDDLRTIPFYVLPRDLPLKP